MNTICCLFNVCASLQTPSKKKVEISSISSNYHIEINPRLETQQLYIHTMYMHVHIHVVMYVHVHTSVSYPLPICTVRVMFFSDAGFHDRVVIQDLLKETAQSQNLESVQKDFKGKFISPSALSPFPLSPRI